MLKANNNNNNNNKNGRNLHLIYSEGSIICENLDINSGIFQGDSLSPLLFCLALTPLSYELNNTEHGYKIGEEKINHLFYMDDLKLYGRNDNMCSKEI